MKLKICEIFTSISGEVGGFPQGSKAMFVRTAGCNLSCPYCDAFESQSMEGAKEMNVVDIAKQVLEQRKQEWFMQKNKVKAVDTLLTQKAKARQQRIDKYEQNQSDEFASQQYIRRQMAN